MDEKKKDNLEELEKQFDELVEEGLATKEEAEKAKKELRKLMAEQGNKKKKFLNNIKSLLLVFLAYMVIYCACFGFYSKHITFENKVYPFVFFAIFAIYNIGMRNNIVSRLIREKTGGFVFLFLSILLTCLLLYFLQRHLYFLEFNSYAFLLGFYFTSEALYLVYNYVMIRRKISRLR